MRDSEMILLQSLETLGRKADRFIFLVIVISLYVFISLLSSQHTAEIPVVEILIENPINYHLTTSLVLFATFGICGSNITNYMGKRYSYESLIFKSSNDDKKIKNSLVPINIYEFIYDKFIGQYVKAKRFPDISRRIGVAGPFLILALSNALTIASAFYLGHYVDIGIDTGYCFTIISTSFFSALIFFFWLSFFQTISRRKEDIHTLSK